MIVSDPIADMLTRIRNAIAAGHDTVDIPSSKIKAEIVRILKREGFVADYVMEGGSRRTLRVYLRYTADRESAIRGLRRMSTPGRRFYVTVEKLPKVLSGMGVAMLSTSKGIMTDAEARQQRLGGEVLCTVW